MLVSLPVRLTAFRTLLAIIVSGARRLWPRQQLLGLKKWWQRERALQRLMAMDDRMLADIGLSRSELHYAVRHGRPERPCQMSAANDNQTLPHAHEDLRQAA